MYRIVVGVDKAESNSKQLAAAIAALPNAAESVEVFVLHCFEDNPSGASATQIGSVRRLTERLDAAGITYEIREDSGDPGAAIRSLAESVDADGIVVGGRKRSPAGKAIFGSVAQNVILESDRPVTVVSS
ncbi:MAG: universal stress protein [Halobacteriota archaeon]